MPRTPKKSAAKEGVRTPLLGPVIRAIRENKRLSAAEVCRRAGSLNARLLCAIEKNRVRNPSIPTLFSVAKGLGVSLGELFTALEIKQDEPIHSGTQKGAFSMELPAWGVRIVSFTPRAKPFFYGKFFLGPRKKFDQTMLKHSYPIFFLALQGRFDVKIGDRSWVLKEGENIFFNAALAHTVTNALQRESALLVTTAPSFL